MTARHALIATGIVGLVGLVFSGYLSYRELLAASPSATCPSVGAPGTVFGQPACVYGFVMYLGILALVALGLRRGKHKTASSPGQSRLTSQRTSP